MFDIGWSEFLIIAVVALLVIGPKDLPGALRTAGRWVRSARRVAAEFQKHVDDMVREAELDDIKKGVQRAQTMNLRREIEKAVDPNDELSKLDPKSEIEKALGPTVGGVRPKPARAAAPAADAASQPAAPNGAAATTDTAPAAGSTAVAEAQAPAAPKPAAKRPAAARKPKAEPVAPAPAGDAPPDETV